MWLVRIYRIVSIRTIFIIHFLSRAIFKKNSEAFFLRPGFLKKGDPVCPVLILELPPKDRQHTSQCAVVVLGKGTHGHEHNPCVGLLSLRHFNHDGGNRVHVEGHESQPGYGGFAQDA